MKRQNKSDSLSVLIPVYNEEKTVCTVLKKLISLNHVDEIIVVDDCSEDSSIQMIKTIQSKKIKFYEHKKNQGKTAAIKTALSHATGKIIIIQDADLEYDPDEIKDVIEPIISGYADVVYGSRFLVKKTSRVLFYYHYLANKFLTTLSNLLTNLNMTDIETCYKAFRSPIIKHMPLSSRGFGMEVEITAMISRLPIRIFEVPISYYGRTYSEGKKIGMKDGFMAIWYILYYNILSVRSGESRRYFQKVLDEL
ncbi:MAG: glycosyltransferase family 2 protein [Spirochaetia bacterium]|nr:glycosyltransferase family 2 protein [Spirochaetia bacterium]